ncbi:MAG TPA: GlsB/YeaQ/YmgE family stress response membrane protein [Euzebya sp.]|nr:GlsB/YeaQ/YmgE family stress response membrane protein [Euzebya sp.]
MGRTLLGWLLIGLLAGAVARFLVPGPDRLGCVGTMGLGLIGSIVGGTLANLLLVGDLRLAPSGFIGSVIGAVVVLAAARVFRRR